MPLPPQIFYQSSLPRAGSTLLQNILAQNPSFYVTPTSGLMPMIFAARTYYTSSAEFNAQDGELMKRAFLGFCRGGMEKYFQAITNKPYIVDKSRGWGVHFDFLNMIFEEEPKIICMVRDIRQILASMEKQSRKFVEQSSSIENYSKLQGTTTYKRVVLNLQSTRFGSALDQISEIQRRGWNDKILFLRFEDFVANPQQVMSRVYTYFGTEAFAHDFANVEQSTQEDDRIYGFPGLHTIRPKVEPLPTDFLSILGADAVRYVQTNFAWFFKLFNYPIISA